MPYITQKDRDRVKEGKPILNAGTLNYRISSLINEYLRSMKALSVHNKVSYTDINDVIGVLECAKLELYRRIASPYEDLKKDENGDVYNV